MSPRSFSAFGWAPIFVFLILISGCGKKKKEEAPKPEVQVPAVSTAVKDISTPEEFTKLLESGQKVIAKFYATWCPPCRRMAPIFDAAAEKYAGKAHFVSLDIDNVKLRDEVDKYTQGSVPTFAFINECAETVDIHPGGYDEKEFDSVVEKFVAKKC
ncbi:TPA: hypothetical protein DDZ86_02020 [Candidatus Dependentiae bacterium]|nr:MAG: hypothetical protein UW09_C0001G0235 [candidate division TM6 bacterium GW2011_GWF2_43_87]HBL98400.1 hypothetical protein [Candidatus Dependentiae bacterium]